MTYLVNLGQEALLGDLAVHLEGFLVFLAHLLRRVSQMLSNERVGCEGRNSNTHREVHFVLTMSAFIASSVGAGGDARSIAADGASPLRMQLTILWGFIVSGSLVRVGGKAGSTQRKSGLGARCSSWPGVLRYAQGDGERRVKADAEVVPWCCKS